MKLGFLDYFRIMFKGRPVLEQAINEGKIVKEHYQKDGIKSLSFWLSMLASGGAIAMQVSGFLPAPTGLIISSSVGVLWALGRGLVKKDDPLGGLKPIATTTEFLANLMPAIAALLMSVQGSVEPQTAAILGAAAASAVGFADALGKSGAQPK